MCLTEDIYKPTSYIPVSINVPIIFMYRFLMRLKGSVRTKNHPEGSIMEWANFNGCLTLCSRYLHGVGQITRQPRIDEDDSTPPFFRSIGQGLAGKCTFSLDHKTWVQAHRYVLFNNDNIAPYLE